VEYSLFTWFGFKQPFAEIVKLIKEAGFHSVMIWWGDFDDEYSVPKEKQPDIVRRAGLKIDNAHFDFGRVNDIWEDSFVGQELYENYLSCLDDCKSYGIPVAVMHASNQFDPLPYNKLGLGRFKALVERAEKNNVIIALENVRRPEYIEFLFNNIDSEKLKFCFDSGHENAFAPHIDFLTQYGDKLAALHLHDNDGSGDQHLMPFNGNINWKRIMAKLEQLKYPGPLGFELDAQFIDVSEDYSAAGFLALAMEKIRQLEKISFR